MATDQTTAKAHVQFVEDFQFQATFPEAAPEVSVLLDETPPLGGQAGPSPVTLLAAAVGGCMSASLTFCLNKAHIETDAMNADVTAHMSRNEAGRLRITGIDVKLTPCLAHEDKAGLERCATLFEDFCIVAQSLRQGIPVDVKVAPCSHRIERTAA